MQKILHIRKSRWILSGWLLISLLALITFLKHGDSTIFEAFTAEALLNSALFLVFAGVAIYVGLELYRNQPQLTLSEEGIRLRKGSLIKWLEISHYRTYTKTDNEGDEHFLVMLLKDNQEHDIPLANLEMSQEDIVREIHRYHPGLEYLGHKRF